MERTSTGTPVGVDDPYAHVDRCDHCTDDGRCRLAVEQPGRDPAFARARRAASYACPVAAGGWEWVDCPHFRSRTHGHACRRCGLESRPNAHAADRRPLLEEHHLSYAADDSAPAHEVTVTLCRWCHAKVHDAWARIDDDVSPDPAAIAERERRRGEEQQELGFRSAAERRGGP